MQTQPQAQPEQNNIPQPNKKPYVSPMLTVHGTIAEITHGPNPTNIGDIPFSGPSFIP